MTDETTKTREQELMEEFKAGLDPAGAAAMAARVDALEEQVHILTVRAETAEASYDEQKARAEKAEKAATATKTKVTRGDTTPKPRKFGPVDDGLSGDALVEALRQADANDKPVAIVVSDGTREVTGIPPIVVTGDVWRPHMLGLMLKEPVKVDGAQPGGTSFMVAGFALLIDGKQVAYCRRSDVVQVAPGQTVSFADDIYF